MYGVCGGLLVCTHVGRRNDRSFRGQGLRHTCLQRQKHGYIRSVRNRQRCKGGCFIYQKKGHGKSLNGSADIICINKKCVLPDGSYDLAVYNCRAAVSVNADMYAVTRRSFKGSISAGKDCTDCTTAEYVLYDGEIYPKEETLWLR